MDAEKLYEPTGRRAMIAALRDRDVTISLGEGFTVRAGTDVGQRARDLAARNPPRRTTEFPAADRHDASSDSQLMPYTGRH